MIHFQKYEGTGNDFILIEDRKGIINWDAGQIQKLCDRHFGIGADGLILLRDKRGFDFEMIYYNADGNTGSMCGNGGRCAVAFAHASGLIKKEITLAAFDGAHQAVIVSADPYLIRLQMQDVDSLESKPDFVFMNTGSPHYTCFRNQVEILDVVSEGRAIRYNSVYQSEGTNVNFAEVKNNELFVRTYERGVEDETLSCGTGVTATALAAHARGLIAGGEATVKTPGGTLRVYFTEKERGYTGIWLEGPARKVFEGRI
jgi:diaminopimelate epimerase